MLLFAAATAIAAVTWWSLPREAAVPAAPKQIVAPTPPPVAEMRRPEFLKVPERIAPDPGVITHEEVTIVERLHELKADLGEPIELERTPPDRLVLTASGLSADRAQQIRQGLAGLPALTMRFVVPHATGGRLRFGCAHASSATNYGFRSRTSPIRRRTSRAGEADWRCAGGRRSAHDVCARAQQSGKAVRGSRTFVRRSSRTGSNKEARPVQCEPGCACFGRAVGTDLRQAGD